MSVDAIRIDAATPLQDRGVDPEAAVAGTSPSEAGAQLWRNQSRDASVGIWTCTPGRLKSMDYPINELCVLLEGKLGLLDPETGEEQIFQAGDTFLVPKGNRAEWVIYETVKKIYMVANND